MPLLLEVSLAGITNISGVRCGFLFMSKKKDYPAMPFYFGDWRKAPEIRALDLDVRMIWFEILGYMWESTERGYLTLNGNPVTTSVIAKMIGIDVKKMEDSLKEMEQFNVFSIRKDGAIFCRKMIKDEELRKLKAKAGRAGMEKRYDKKCYNKYITEPITQTLTNTEDENENEYINNSVIEIYNDTDISFNNFWNIYNKKVDKPDCIDKWSKLSKKKKKLAIDYIPAYKKSRPDKFTRRDPIRYLRKEVWNNEIVEEKTAESIKETPSKIPWKYDKKITGK